MTQFQIDLTKAALGLLGFALAILGLWLERSGRSRRAWERALAVLGLFAFLSWWNLGQFHFPDYLHRWELYHYVVGAKYFRELGYTDLYRCAVAADAEFSGSEAVRGRTIRDPATNRMVGAETALERTDRCGERFSAARWASFKSDVGWFRRQMPGLWWHEAQQDHGFNATPAWLVAGLPLSNLMPVSTVSLTLLALVDPFLLGVMWLAVWWAFGWRATCIAVIFWGSNYAGRFWWTGGSFLRQDWLSAAVVGVCLLRRGHHGWAGALLAYSSLLRVFPAALPAAIGLAAVLNAWRERRPTVAPEHRRFALGSALAVVLVAPLSVWVTGDVSVWARFVENTRLHLGTPLTNDMGLPTVVAYDHGTRARLVKDESFADPYELWKRERDSTFERRRALYWLCLGLFLLLQARAVRGREDWVVACLGVGWIPVAAGLTCYYYSILLCLGLLWTNERRAGIALLGFGAASSVIPALTGWYDELFTAASVVAVASVIYVTSLFARRTAAASEPAS